MPIPFNKMFFAQNVMPRPLPDPPDPDPGDPDLSGCAIDTDTHPRWEDGGQNHYGSDWFGLKIVPSGVRYGGASDFYDIGEYRVIGFRGSYISLSIGGGEYTGNVASFANDNGELRRGWTVSFRTGRAVRCVRDETVGEASDPDGTIYTDDYTDGSGNKYDGVKIGEHIWLKKNLITTKYQNGTDIETGLSDTQWGETTSGAYAIYPYSIVSGINSDQDMIDRYGILYNHYAAGSGLVTGLYRIPFDEDWVILRNYLISEYEGLHVSNVAMVLKSCRQVNHPLA